MPRPWDISGDDIVEWAARIESASTLPKLVRRLVHETTSMREFSMAADAGVRLGGWDGVGTANEGHAFVPVGSSGWELTIQADLDKLNGDYAKRAEDPTPLEAASTTYVAVVGRRYSKKLDWAATKRKEAVFAGVRSLDADDLASWLEGAPSTARWFASQLGRVVEGVVDIETFVDAWSTRTAPPLPCSLVLLGIDRQRRARDLVAWLGQPPGNKRILTVQADTRDEGTLFIASALMSSTEPEHWLAKTVIVQSREAWRSLTQERGSQELFLIADFDEAASEVSRFKGRASLVLERGQVQKQALVLDVLPFSLMVAELEKSFVHAEAQRISRDSGGKLTALQRLLGYTEQPKWVHASDRRCLTALLLVGAWEPDNPADQAAITSLGVSVPEMEAACTRLLSVPDAPVVLDETRWGRRAFRWVSPLDAWKTLHTDVSGTLARATAALAGRVLAEDDPRYAAGVADPQMALILDAAPRYSTALREGLAQTLIMFIVFEEHLAPALGARLSSDLVNGTVRAVLPPQLQRWRSLGEILPRLAEAAPRAFLDAVDLLMAKQRAGELAGLSSKPELGRAPHIGLFWALEGLGYRTDVFSRVLDVLTDLTTVDAEGKCIGRAYQSLGTLLHEAIPGSTTSAAQRVAALEQAYRRRPEVGWQLAVEMLPDVIAGFWISPHYPEFSLPSGIRPRREAATVNEYLEQIKGAATFALRKVGQDPSRWLSLLTQALRSGDQVEDQVLSALEEHASAIIDPESQLWAKVRESIYWKKRREIKEQRPVRNMDRLTRLYELLVPTDHALRVAWLFRYHSEMPDCPSEDYRDREKFAETKRVEALEVIWRLEDAERVLERLATTMPQGMHWLLGEALARTSFAHHIETRMLLASWPALENASAAFMIIRAREHPPGWLFETIQHLLQQHRIPDAARIASAMANGSDHWDRIESLGEPLRTAYWSTVHPWSAELSPDEVDRCVAELLRVDRVAHAVECASLLSQKLVPETALQVLEAARSRIPDLLTTMSITSIGHNVRELFSVVDRDPSVDEDRLSALEGAFFSFLRDMGRRLVVFNQMGTSPELFTDLVKALYRRAGDRGAETTPEERAQRKRQAEIAYHVLDAWRGGPGDSLTTPDRDAAQLRWAKEVIERTRSDGRGALGITEVAKVLARLPAAPDGLWPCLAARQLLQFVHDGTPSEMESETVNLSDDERRYEVGQRTRLLSALGMAKRNLGGASMRSVGEGGVLERAEASNYREDADILRLDWPETALLLERLSEESDREAAQADRSALTDRTREGLDHPTPTGTRRNFR